MEVRQSVEMSLTGWTLTVVWLVGSLLLCSPKCSIAYSFHTIGG